mmetsp:Transcript_6631/g.18865  ORF Transcript_6631/g.18865 Transcript_6631/m.18865 type:complete len:96 (-) Transcript_6631:1631-1918(-)
MAAAPAKGSGGAAATEPGSWGPLLRAVGASTCCRVRPQPWQPPAAAPPQANDDEEECGGRGLAAAKDVAPETGTRSHPPNALRALTANLVARHHR